MHVHFSKSVMLMQAGTDLLLGRELRNILALGEGLEDGRLCGDIGGEADGLAHICQAGQQQEVGGEHGRHELQDGADRDHQSRDEAEPLQVMMNPDAL